MRITKDQESAEAVNLARTIISIPSGEVSDAIRGMVSRRKLSRTVIALDDLIVKHPEYKHIAAKALHRLGLWHAG